MSRIYLDANSIIYLIEAVSPFHVDVAARLLPHIERTPSLASSPHDCPY